MKRETNRKKEISFTHKRCWIALAVASLLCLTGCGAAKDASAGRDEAALEFSAVESTEKEILMEEEPEREEESAQEEEAGEEEYWIEAYKEFLRSSMNLLPLLKEEFDGGRQGYISGFFLMDVDGNGVPELFVQKYLYAEYMYTCVDGKVEMRARIPDSGYSECISGYDALTGQAYHFIYAEALEEGALNSLSMTGLMLPEQEYSESAEDTEKYRDALYKPLGYAEYGYQYQEDGTAREIRPEDAILSEDCVLSREKYVKMLDNFTPFHYQPVTEENLDKYLQKDYQETDMYDPYTPEEYIRDLQQRLDEYRNLAPRIVEGSGEALPASIAVGEDVNGTVYYDMETLCCFRESDIFVKFAEDWKNIYYDWLRDIGTKVDESGIPLIGSMEFSSIWFEEWEGMEAPVLHIWTDGFFRDQCYMIRNGQVENISKSDTEVTIVTFIQNTEYFLTIYPQSVYCGGFLSRLTEDGTEMVATLYGGGVMTRVLYGELADFDTSQVEYAYMDQEMSREEFISEVDALLGEGAGWQLINAVFEGYAEYVDSFPSPLTFSESDGTFMLSQAEDALRIY